MHTICSETQALNVMADVLASAQDRVGLSGRASGALQDAMQAVNRQRTGYQTWPRTADDLLYALQGKPSDGDDSGWIAYRAIDACRVIAAIYL